MPRISTWTHYIRRSRSAHPRQPLLLLLVGLWLAACSRTPTPPPEPIPQPSPQAGTALPRTALPASTDARGEDQLVVWMSPISGFAAEGSAGVILNNAFVQFEQQHPGIQLDVLIKAETGTAGLLNYLRSAQQSAPSILPDLVLINTQQLWQIADLGMVQPIDAGEMAAGVEFYDVARRAVTYQDRWLGVPYALDLIHLAFDPVATPAPPADWAALLAGEQAYFFPGAETAPAGELLLQYIGAGGQLREDGGVADPQALRDYFDFLARARSREVIPHMVGDLADYPAVWRAFTDAPGNLATVQVSQYYPTAGGAAVPGYAPIPTRQGVPTTVVETWAFAVLTTDTTRRGLAVELINALLRPEVQGPWSQFSARLPSQPQALALWTQGGDYRTFLQTLLAGAQSPPNGVAFAEFTRRLQSTRAALLRGEISVEEAMQLVAVVQ